MLPTGGTLGSISSAAVVGGSNIVFLGFCINNGQQVRGIYIYTGLRGFIDKVIEDGDLLDGKVTSQVNYLADGSSPGGLVFKAEFRDGSNGIYRAFGVTRTPIGQNVVADPSFENGPARGLHPHDTPWGGEEVGSPAGVEIMQGSAADGTQFARMRSVSSTGSACPGCNESFMFQRIDVTPYTDYTFVFGCAGRPL